LFSIDLVTVESVFSEKFTGEGRCLAKTVSDQMAASVSFSGMAR